MIFSAAISASWAGVAGSMSLVSATTTLRGFFSAPTLTPPLALISSTANCMAFAESYPQSVLRGVGTPKTIGSAEWATVREMQKERHATRTTIRATYCDIFIFHLHGSLQVSHPRSTTGTIHDTPAPSF